MRVALDASPFDVIPQAMLDGFRRSVVEAANLWAIPIDLTTLDSVAEAVGRYNAYVIEQDRRIQGVPGKDGSGG